MDLWWEPGQSAPQPGTRDGCCCCCDKVSWANVLKTTVKGTLRARNYWRTYPLAPRNNTTFIDHAIPYPLSCPFDPCVSTAPRPRGARWDSFNDTPGWEVVKTFFDKGGTEFTQEFETCAYCASGPEAFVQTATIPLVRPLTFMVTYCCFTWKHTAAKNGPNRSISRSTNGGRVDIRDFDYEDVPISNGLFPLIDQAQCKAPSNALFKSGVLSGRVHSTKPVPPRRC